MTSSFETEFSSKLESKSRKKSSSLKNLNLFGRSKRPIQVLSNGKDDEKSSYWITTNLNANNNGTPTAAMLDLPTTPEAPQNPPDYRTFLRNIRPPVRPPLSCSEDDSNDDEDYDENPDDVTINDRLELDQNPCEEELTSNDPEVALSQLGSLRGSHAILKINITEQKIIKCYRVNIFESIWTIKQRIIQSLPNKPSFAFNYGLFSPKTGKFLLDHRQIVEYIAAGTIVPYEFRYKRRVFHVVIRNRKDSRKLVKMQNVTKQRELMTYVQQRNCEKLHSLIKKGVDPNFHQEDGEETPLTMVSTMVTSQTGDARSMMTSSQTEKRRRSFLRSSSLRKSWSRSMANLNQQLNPPPLTPVLLALVGAGGAHLDFRNRHGFTPLHVAARSGNTSALKSLLELGASPDVVDMKGLTPLYHCCSMNVADDECVSVLLRHKAAIDCVDSQKWNVLHQMCRYGHLDHLCVFLQRIKSSEEQEDRLLLDSQNATGNTPLHVCALYNQEFCLLTLLDHGADPSVRNFANQDPFQVAIVAGNANLAKLITEYPDMQKQGHQVPSHHRPTMSSVGPAMTSAVETSSPNRRHTFTPATFIKKEGKTKSSSTADMTSRVEREAKRRQEPKIMNPANSKLQRYDTDLPPNATLPRSSILYQSSKKSSPKKQAPPNDTSSLMYIALEDYDPDPGQDHEDHLTLRVGDRVCVSSPKSASDLYCLGTIGDRSGLVPLRCLQPVQLRRPFNQSTTATSVETPFSKLHQQGEDEDETNRNSSNNNNRPKEMRPLPKKEEKKPSSHHVPVVQHTTTTTDDEGSSVVHKYKNVIINKGADGYGFVLRGTKANGEELQGKFQPNSRNPGLQYLESVDPHGAAYLGGLRAGDVILKVNGTDVRFMGHGQIVEFIRKCGRTLHMHVASVITQQDSSSGTSSMTSSPKRPVSCMIPPPPAITSSPIKRSDVTANGHPQQRHTRTGSVVSAISKLDNVIAVESGKLSDSDDVADSATLRRRPGSRQIRPSELQDVFLRKTAQKQDQQGEQPYNKTTTLSRQLIKVTTPTLPNKETPSPHRATSTSSVFGNDTASSTSPATSSPRSRPSSQLFQDELLATIKRGPKKKLPPPPPKRTDSKLSTSGLPPSDNKEEPEKLTGAQIAASVEESIRNRIQSSASSREPPPVKSKLKAAELKKARAASTSQVDSNADVTCSPLELALKAKKQSLNRQNSETEDTPVVTNSLVKPSDIKMQKPPRLNKPTNHNSTKKSETTFDLPPPPAPVQDLQNELFNHPRFGASVDLPPPPDEAILNSPDTFSVMPSSVELPPPPPLTFSKNSGGGDISSLLPPATSFVDGHTSSGKIDTSSSGSVIETSSNTDSGIEPNQLHHQTIETGSIISTLSNVSSEDGSDFGVSMAFDKSEAGGNAKQAYLELIKKHNQHQSLPIVNNNTKVASNQPIMTSPTDAKSLATWTVQDVGDWLRGLGLDVYVSAFAENEIAGMHLPDLGKDELAELGVKRIGHRLTIEKSLKQLR